jgi:hypothetical protein
LLTQDVELILAITFGKDQGLARSKREKERVTPEFGERKEEKNSTPKFRVLQYPCAGAPTRTSGECRLFDTLGKIGGVF